MASRKRKPNRFVVNNDATLDYLFDTPVLPWETDLATIDAIKADPTNPINLNAKFQERILYAPKIRTGRGIPQISKIIPPSKTLVPKAASPKTGVPIVVPKAPITLPKPIVPSKAPIIVPKPALPITTPKPPVPKPPVPKPPVPKPALPITAPKPPAPKPPVPKPALPITKPKPPAPKPTVPIAVPKPALPITKPKPPAPKPPVPKPALPITAPKPPAPKPALQIQVPKLPVPKPGLQITAPKPPVPKPGLQIQVPKLPVTKPLVPKPTVHTAVTKLPVTKPLVPKPTVHTAVTKPIVPKPAVPKPIVPSKSPPRETVKKPNINALKPITRVEQKVPEVIYGEKHGKFRSKITTQLKPHIPNIDDDQEVTSSVKYTADAKKISLPQFNTTVVAPIIDDEIIIDTDQSSNIQAKINDNIRDILLSINVDKLNKGRTKRGESYSRPELTAFVSKLGLPTSEKKKEALIADIMNMREQMGLS